MISILHVQDDFEFSTVLKTEFLTLLSEKYKDSEPTTVYLPHVRFPLFFIAN